MATAEVEVMSPGSIGPAKIAKSCEICDTEDHVIFCTGCNEYYCESCWSKRRAHKDEKSLGPGGIPHEQVDPDIVERVDECMAEPQDEGDEKEQHENDQETTWFGLDHDMGGEPVLSEYRRYAAIMMDASASETTPVRYPGLVSFVGQTGAGKSTLIRLLIDPKKSAEGGHAAPAAAPVLGRSDSEVPTSADVHLYADPKTFSEKQPILFADCEGFDGGERDPVAMASGRSGSSTSASGVKRKPVPAQNGLLRRMIPGTKRVLRWARRDAPNHEKTGKRQYAIAEMYPRIFYAFSDVIVFVLNNPKTMEDVVEKLIVWADTNYSKSINLPSKPHAIIALNKCNNSTPESLWNHFTSTDELFRSMNAQIHKNKTFQAYVKKWQSAHFRISDMDELFGCYYSSVHVLRLPDKSRYALLSRQRDELYGLVARCCAKSFTKKQDNRMLPDADEFGLCLSLAFDHFSQTLDEPFDYVQASLKYKPPPETMADNLYVFAQVVGEKMGLEGHIEPLFNKLTDMVASCLMLDSVRNRRFGQPEDWFKADVSPSGSQRNGQSGQKSKPGSSYNDLCKNVVSRYFNHDVTCTFRVEARTWPLERHFECQGRRFNHEYTHREKSGVVKFEHYGLFEHPFNPRDFAWQERVLASMVHMQQREPAWAEAAGSRGARAEAHGRTVRAFYRDLVATGEGIFCNSVCLCCLSNYPDYELSCGHFVCLECAKDFGRLNGNHQISLEQCPLDCLWSKYGLVGTPMSQPTTIDLDPQYSGLRVLLLDGGGVRGIVELCVLKAIENRLGIPLQLFFDLVVGTSTGGIISLGLGHELWSIDECIERFKALVGKVFTKRRVQNIQGLRYVEMIIKRSRYETKPLEEALRSTFGEDKLFCKREKNGSRRLRVAVTAVSEAGQRAYVLSNYNVRNYPVISQGTTETKLDYHRYRTQRPEDELKVWEAARGTSAAPGFFKPFAKAAPPHSPSHKFPELMDGALRHNNPIYLAMEETRRLTTAQDLHPVPDLVLSLGTGLPRHLSHEEDEALRPVKEHQQQQKHAGSKPYKKQPFIWTIFTLISYQIKLNLDAEDRWRGWSEPLVRDPLWRDRVFRVNPDFGEQPPPMDDVSKVQSLFNNVVGWLGTNAEARDQIGEVACVLVATSFYFEREGNPVQTSSSSSSSTGSTGPRGGIELHGRIRCRLGNSSAHIKALGMFLASCHSPASFVVHADASDGAEHRVELDVDAMMHKGCFKEVPVAVNIPGEDTSTRISMDLRGLVGKRRMYNISGFPRQLMRCDFRPGQPKY